MAAVTLTKHAIERMRQRGITKHEVIRVLAFGDQMPTRQPAVYRSRIPGGRRSNNSQDAGCVNNVVVVYRQGDRSDEHQVMTAFRRLPTPCTVLR